MTIPVDRSRLRKIIRQEVSAERRRAQRKHRVLICLLFVLAMLCVGLVKKQSPEVMKMSLKHIAG